MFENHYLIDISNNIPLITTFNRFIKLHPEFYQQRVNHKIVVAENGDVCMIYDEPVQFNDEIHNANGWIITEYEMEKLTNGLTQQQYKFHVWVEKSAAPLYHLQVQDYIQRQARHGDRVQLNYYKILNEQLITHNFYDAPLANWLDDVEQLKNEFFSPHKRYLFDVMTQSNRNGNWSNLILYGEPGTGKSSFVFRLATQLKMSIISVDLSMYIDRKRDLYSIFHGNEFYLPYGKGNKLAISQNCIIILEEFDSSIEKIRQLENIFIFKSDTIHSYVSNKTNEIGQQVQNSMANHLQPDVPLSTPFQYLVDKQNADKGGLDPLKITSEIFDIVRTITEDNKSDILRLRDLLELFQGPVPIRDRIIVATTNNFEQIKGIIPPLFRPGRLTPIKFTYLDWPSLVELCQYYFDEQPTMPQFEIGIPTSQITELAIKYVSMANAGVEGDLFAEFQHELIELNNKRKNVIIEEKKITVPVAPAPVASVPTMPTSIVAPENTLDMYSKWIDEKLGSSKPVAKPQQAKPVVRQPTGQQRKIQQRPVARQTVQQKGEEEEKIRNMAVDKVLAKDKELMSTLPGYNGDQMILDYQQVAVMTPHNEDFN